MLKNLGLGFVPETDTDTASFTHCHGSLSTAEQKCTGGARRVAAGDQAGGPVGHNRIFFFIFDASARDG